MTASVFFGRIASVAMIVMAAATSASAQMNGASTSSADPRVGLKGGFTDAAEASRNMTLVGHGAKPEGWYDPKDHGNFDFANSDLAFSGNYVFQGGWHGFQVWDISKPSAPASRLRFVCPGGQGDPSVYKNLLFISVQSITARTDCGTQGDTGSVSSARFRGVRIFDISDLDHPRQVAAVQTCRGSHTHTLVTDPRDPANIYVYVQGTSTVRPAAELAGCSNLPPEQDPNSSLFRIEVIRVPLASPQDAKIVNTPRIFADSGRIAGLWHGGAHGPGTQTTTETNMCHDITAYPAIGLAAGACSGNGILLDIRDPANPKRVAEVTDPNFAYWHSATFSNDGGSVLFTDEWGGGTLAKCLATDRPEWGADAIFTVENGKLHPAGYYKLPAPQTEKENCVAHNGALIPVPGRDIMSQGWYQGGVSVFDFTDPNHPFEIAFFDRGPMDDTLSLGGEWSAYWYNGHIIASEIGRGLDVFELKPSEFLTQNEIDAAKLVRFEQYNPQDQQKFVWPASFVVARAYLDGLVRSDALRKSWSTPAYRELERAEKLKGAARRTALTKLAAQLDKDARGTSDSKRVRALAATVRDLANASR